MRSKTLQSFTHSYIYTYMPNAPRRILDVTAACPLSGTRLPNKIIKQHRIRWEIARKGLYAVCNVHGVRIFATDALLVAEILQQAGILGEAHG